MVLSLMVLVMGWDYYSRQFAINWVEKEIPKEAKTFQVLSFNVHMFNRHADHDAKERAGSTEMIDWIATHPADIYCLQEFYNDPASDVYNAISRIGIRYEKQHFFSVVSPEEKRKGFGLAIFSRYPIINSGTIHFRASSLNRVAWADLVVQGDTLRVYATHLQSMSIKAEDIENTYQSIGNQEEMEREGRNLARRLRNGFVARGYQVELLIEHFEKSPYPFIVCGDFNDIPFSYTYDKLAKRLSNSFEVAGNGIGATYNGPIPFLRIDNQFYSAGLRAYDFNTHQEMGLSDHLPISAKYMIEPVESENTVAGNN